MTNRTRVIFYLLLLSCVILTGQYLLPIAIGAMFAYLSEEPFFRLCHKLKVKRNHTQWVFASVLVTVIVILFMVPVILGVVSGILQISEMVLKNRETIVSNLQTAEINRWLERFDLPVSFSELANRISQFISSAAQAVAAAVGVVLQATPEVLIKLLLGIFAWVVFLMEGEKYRKTILPLIIPWQPEREIICQTTADVLRGVVVASALVSLVQCVIVTILLLVSKTPNAFLLGVLTFFASFVPLVGTAPILFGAAIYKYFDGSVGWAIFLALSVIGVGSIDNFLRPYFFKGSVDLSFFWITTAFLGGLATAGLAGAVLGPLLFSLFFVFYKRTFPVHAETKAQ